ncbi:MAG: MBL fold metallo-hydrolase [Clostridia bacterium]
MKVELIGTGSMYTSFHGACALIDEQVLIDMPNGTVKQLLRQNHVIEDIKTVLITHKHGDHTADIPFLFKYLRVQTGERRKLTMIGPEGLYEKILQLFQAYNFEEGKQIEDLVDLECIEIKKEQEELFINGYAVQAFFVSHGDERPCYGYLLNHKLGYTGDTTLCVGVEKIWHSSKVMIADSNFNKEITTHMHLEHIKNLVTRQEDKILITTHMGDGTREALHKEKIPHVVIPEDGYTFEV